MQIDILTLFPDYFETPLKQSMIKRAIEKECVSINIWGLREFAEDKHRRVDDRPFGGGAGMVLKPEPLLKGIRQLRKEKSHVILFSARGKLLNAKRCRELAVKSHLLLVTGHYEGVDERVSKEIDEEISIGDFVLTNGAPAAMVLLDSVVRLIPGVLGNEMGTLHESFEKEILEHAQYTRPACFEGESVPEVLLSGDPSMIANWQRINAMQKTKSFREDLYLSYMSQGEEGYFLTLEVKQMDLSILFYKRLGFTLESQEEAKAFLRLESLGVILVAGSPRVGTSMYRVSVDHALFRRARAFLQKKQAVLEGSNDQRLFFRDDDGHQWVIFDRCEKERKNGKESFSGES